MLTINAILDSKAGAAAKAFLRVALAAAFGAWAMAGFPISELTGSDLEQYLQAGLAAGAALVGINAAGPWETRYGRQPERNEAGSLALPWPARRSDPATRGITRLWHGAFCRWYDHDRAGHKVRARIWGRIADLLARWA